MIPKTTNVINSLCLYPLQESRIRRIRSTRKHKVLPDEYTILISKVIEKIILICPATPYTNHIHIGFLHITEQGLISFSSNIRQQCILRNIIGSFGKHRYAIDLKIKRLSILIFFIHNTNRSQTDPVRLLCNNPFSTSYLNREVIQSRSSPTIRHPSYRIRHLRRKSYMIYSGLQFHLLFDFCNSSTIQRNTNSYFSRNFLRKDLVYNEFIR